MSFHFGTSHKEKRAANGNPFQITRLRRDFNELHPLFSMIEQLD
ncbi:MAG: hypothetical protein ACJAZ4_001110 [Neptuniibacter pectenicola]|jgi:hypothetical protein|tara:strand:+ start:96 stop:227 length:132 start_codon:yes stop_codon:yes gene_type:complete